MSEFSASASPPPDAPVVIIGGGLAGLAVAVGLAGQGVPVTLLEARDRLGGRASSFVDPESGETIDNCQHVSMGCCTNLQHFCRTIGVDDCFRVEPELTFVDPDGGRSTLRSSSLPCPLHLAPSFATLRYLSLGDKLRLARGLRQLARMKPHDISATESFRSWLERHGQSNRVIERFWEVVLVSALSESLDRIDIGHARKVFVDGFLRHRDGWRVHVPNVPLDELYGRPVIDYLTERGSQVRTLAAARGLHGGVDGIVSVELRNGERVDGADYVLAVPHGRVLDLLPTEVAAPSQIAGVREIESAPITSLHLWFDREITDLPHAVLMGRLSQWLFRRGPQRSEPDSQHLYQIVISASRSLEQHSREQVRDLVVEELRDVWPAAREARLLHWRMVTERTAVFSVTPGIDARRPAQQTPVSNLQLAGDWTATGWPATMEGAVRSGYLAAENVLQRRGVEAKLVQPDLPTSRISRVLFGL